MRRLVVFLALGFVVVSAFAQGDDRPSAMSVCELSRNYPAFREKTVTVRGVYYYGLRQECQQKCASGLWPSFIDLEGGTQGVFDELAKTLISVENDAKATGKRFEIWVTVVGRLQTRAKLARGSPCDRKSWGLGYGHLGVFPAQIVVGSIRDVKVKINPQSSYDYANMYHGPL